MQLNWEKFQTEYQKATEKTKALIDGETIPLCVASAITKYNLPPTLKRELTVSVINKLLNLTDDGEIYTQLTKSGLDASRAAGILGGLLTCSLTNDPTVFAAPTPSQPTSTTPAVRTMTSDGKQIGYQSLEDVEYTNVQAAILHESK